MNLLNKYQKYVYAIFLGILLFAAGGIYFNHIYSMKLDSFNGQTPVNQDSSLKTKNLEIDIKFRFKFKGFTETTQTQTLFQAYEGDTNISLQMGNGSSCPFCTKGAKTVTDIANSGSGYWAIIIDNPKVGTPHNIQLNSFPLENIWYKAEIKIKGKKLYFYLNGELNTKSTIKNRFNLSKFTVGSNKDGENLFNGQIRKFCFKMSSFSPSAYKLIDWSIVLLSLFAALMFRKKYFLRQDFKTILQGRFTLYNLFLFCGFIFTLTAFQRLYHNFQPFALLQIESFLLCCLLVFYLWKKAGFNRFFEVFFYFGIFVYLKSYFLKTSVIGLYADFLTVVTLFAFLKYLSRQSIFRLWGIPILSVINFFIFIILALGACYVKTLEVRVLAMNEMWAVFQSNPAEMWGFCTTFFSAGSFTYILFFAITSTIIFWGAFRQPEGNKLTAFACRFVLLLVLGTGIVTYHAGKSQSFVSPVMASIGDYKNTLKQFRKFQAIRKENKDTLQATKEGQGETYVLIIGESSNPAHWGAYGYFRDTTPWASSLKENRQALFFDNAYASYVHTVPALLKALTAANQYNQKNDFISVTLPQIAAAAGFKVYWLSNQNKYSVVDNPLTVLAEMANKNKFTEAVSVDENLLPLLESQLSVLDSSHNNLIIIHVIGSHAPYLTRIPQDYRPQFASGEQDIGDISHNKKYVKKILNPYDMTIKYSDSVLERIYRMINDKYKKPEAFIYISDHGEDVLGERFHNASQFSWEMSHIPMFGIFSENYQNKYLNQFNRLQKREKEVFTLDCLYDTLLGIMNIKTNEYSKTCDLASPNYAINRQNALTLYTDKNLQTNLYANTEPLHLKEDVRYIERENLNYLNKQYPNKFLAVHTDAVAATYNALSKGFTGVEINVAAPGLNIGHAPHKVYKMTLEDFLKKVPHEKLSKIWIDMKELKEEDIDETLFKLNELDKKYNLKSRTILENTLVSSQMKKFAEAGWHTSYYFFVKFNDEDINRGLDSSYLELITKKSHTQQEKLELTNLAKSISEDVKKQKSSAISFYAMYYPFFKNFVEPLLPQDIVYHTWSIDGIPSIKDKSLILNPFWKENKIINDKRVKSILISPESRFAISM